MTENELNRIKIIQDVCDKQITGVLFFNKKAEENLDLI